MIQPEKEITKAEFRLLYFQNATLNSGWTQEYWNMFFENKEEQYFLLSDKKEDSRMFIRSENGKHTIFFMSEDAEESFFNFPQRD